VAYSWNPNYSGGGDQEDRGSKPDQANSLRDPISKKPKAQKGCGVAQGVVLSSGPGTGKKKKKQQLMSSLCVYRM
jgi:hypothetical protein